MELRRRVVRRDRSTGRLLLALVVGRQIRALVVRLAMTVTYREPYGPTKVGPYTRRGTQNLSRKPTRKIRGARISDG